MADACLCVWCGVVCVYCVFAPLSPSTFSQFITALVISDPFASLPAENASIFCAILQGFPLITTGNCMCTIHFQPPHYKKKRERRGGSRVNSRRIAAGTQLQGVLWRKLKEWPVVLGSSRIVCQAPSLPLSSVLSFMSIILPFKQSQQGISSCGSKEMVKRDFLKEASLRTC